MFWLLLGFLYGCFFEHTFHRYVFHGLGKKKSSIFAFHLRVHHFTAKRSDFRDSRFSYNEIIGLTFLALAHTPVYFISPLLYFSICTYAALFIIIHNIIHRYPSLGKKYIWWHWNHHMMNQNKSWGVVCPLMDIIAGTLEEKKNDGNK